MAFCARCGASLSEGSLLCTACGAKQEQAASQQDEWDSFGDDVSYASKPRKTIPQKGMLRVLSVFFAIGFLVFAFGLGLKIFYNRQVDYSVNELFEPQMEEIDKGVAQGRLTDEEAREQRKELEKIINPAKKSSGRVMAPSLRLDVIGTIRASIPEIGDYDLSDYTTEEKESLRDDIQKAKESVEDAIAKLTEKDIREYRRNLDKSRSEGVDKAGARYIWLILSAYNFIIMIVGGALALITLIAWLALGGLRGTLSQTTVLPLVITFVVLGIILMIFSGLVMAPIRAEEM